MGERIRRARQARKPKMTLAELAGTRLSISLVSKIERGLVRPSLPTLGYLADRLGLPIASLLDSKDTSTALSPINSSAESFIRAEAYLGLGDPVAALALLDGQVVASDLRSLPVVALRALALLVSGRLDEAASVAQTIESQSVGAAEDWPSSRQGRSRSGHDALDSRGESAVSNRSGGQAPESRHVRRAGQTPEPAPTGWQRISEKLRPASTEVDDAFARARAAFVIGEVARQRGRDAAAVDGFRRCLRTSGDSVWWVDLQTRALRALAALYDDRGDAETARNLYRQAAALLVQTAHPRQRAARWLRLSELLERAGDHAGANLAVARAAELAALLEGEAVRVDVDARLGRLAAVVNDRASADRFYRDDGAGSNAVGRRD